MRHQITSARAELKTQPAGYTFSTTAYDHFQVIYITDGQLNFRTQRSEQILSAGAGIVLRIGSAFHLSCTETGYLGVGVNIFDDAVNAFHGEAAAFVGNLALHGVAGMIRQEIAEPDTGTDEMLAGLGSLLCWHALRLAGATSLLSDTSHDWAERARQAILATLTTGHSVRDVLGDLPLSYRQLARHFTAQFGQSPKQYQQHCRLEEIKRLLSETPVSITTIAYEFGYPSSQHFSAQFLRTTGLTPGAYRRQHRM